MKVIACEDGYVAFQNGIYEHNGISGSSICMFFSVDGKQWNYLNETPVLKPNSENAWMARQTYA